MDRRALWPDFRAEWVLYEDDDVIAVDKPAGVPSMDDDGVPARLARWLAARDAGEGAAPAYLGIHQRLDRETSGVILYAKRKEANAGLARAFEQRSVEKVYAAIVEGWPKGAARTFRDRLEKTKDGRVHVGRRGQVAITHARELERHGARSLLEVRIETGRTHQIRAQLAHAGAPIVGDTLYGGAPAPRLMLHARSIALAHPTTGDRLRVESPLPAEMRDPRVNLGRVPRLTGAVVNLGRVPRLTGAVERRWGLGRSEGTTAFRLVNGAGDGMAGVAVDVYGDFAVVHLYDEEIERDGLLDAVAGLGFDGVYLKVRPKQANELVDTRREDVAPSGPVRGRAAPFEMTVRENGMPFVVRLGDGLSTGIFLDQRENRRRVRELSRGASVLNLFAYTCPFTVAAALGGAARTLSVDASAPALERGERQVRALGTTGDHAFVRGDAFATLDRLARDGERFDLVIADPPTYSTTKKTRWKSGRDWVGLARACIEVLAPGGRLLACTNDQRTSTQAFRRYLHEALRAAGQGAVQMKSLPVPPDFPPPPGDRPHLESVLLRLKSS